MRSPKGNHKKGYLRTHDPVSAPMEAQLRNNVPKVEESSDGKEHLSSFVPVVYHHVTKYLRRF